MSEHDFFLDGASAGGIDADGPPVAVAEQKPAAPAATSARDSRPAGAPAAATVTTPVAATARSRRPVLYLDLETVPDWLRLESFGLDPVADLPDETPLATCPDVAQVIAGTADAIKLALRGLSPPAEWLAQLAAAERAGKDRSGVHGHIESARQARQAALAAQAERIKLLSTTPEYCAIAALGWAVGDGPVQSLVVGSAVPGDDRLAPALVDEIDLLDEFWALVGQAGQLCGFNVLAFDLPVLFARSAILGVRPTRHFDLRPWGPDVLDLYLARFGGRGNTDRQRPGKLKQLARLYGINVPAEGIDGGQVHELVAAGDWATVARYVASDVEITRRLHRRLAGFFWK